MIDQRVVFLTGAGSGFGRLTSEALARRGHLVIAGVHDGREDQAEELTRLADTEKLPLHIVMLDVTRDDSVRAAVDRALDITKRIDVLVNNAGLGAFGITEAFTVDQVEAQLATNVLGVLRMNRAVLPHMRAAGRGLLVQLSTSIGRVPMPFMGVYGATKAAAEMFAEEGRYLLSPLGIDSVIVEAGIYPTPMLGKMVQPEDAERVGAYGPVVGLLGQLGEAMQGMLSGPSAPDPAEVAEAIVALIEMTPGTRPLRTLVGKTHAQGVKELNEATDRIVEGWYPMMGLSSLLELSGE